MYRVLRQCANFIWDAEAEEAFKVLKMYLAHLSKIANPVSCETLLLYLAISE